MSDFTQKVYGAVKKIPRGRVATYKDIVQLIGSPRAARAVGSALSKNNSLEIPCHRVIRSDGDTGYYVHGAGRKIEILQAEKIKITKGKVNKRFIIKSF